MSGLIGRGNARQVLSVNDLEASVGAPHGVPSSSDYGRTGNGNETSLISG